MPFTPSSIRPRQPAPQPSARASAPVVAPRARTSSAAAQNSASSYMSQIPATGTQVRTPAPITARTPAPIGNTTTRGQYGTIQHINGGIVYSDPRDNPNFAGNQITPAEPTRPTTVIPAESVGNVTPAPVVPTPAADTTGLANINNTNTAQVKTDAATTPAETPQDTAKSGIQTQISDYIKRITGQPDEVNKLKTDIGLQQKKQRATSLANEIDQYDKDFRDKVKAIRENPGSVSAAGISSEISNEQTKYEDTRANMYLSYRIANQDYQGAEDLVNEKVTSLDKQNAALLSAYQLQASYIYNDLTESEKLKVQDNYQTMRDNHQATLSAYSDVMKTAAANGAPTSVLSAIDAAAKDPSATPAAVYSAAGSYGRSTPAISTQVVDVGGKKMLINSKTGAIIKEYSEGDAASSALQIAQTEGNISQVSDLIKDKYLTSAVGPNALARTSFSNFATGGKDNFIAGIEQLRSNLNLDALIQAKAKGATFGALSDQELKVLSSSATKLGTWAQKDSSGNVTGYKASEKAFKAELQKINNYAKLDYILKGGSPAAVGAQLMTDGTIWSQDSNGNFTKLR